MAQEMSNVGISDYLMGKWLVCWNSPEDILGTISISSEEQVRRKKKEEERTLEQP